MKGIENVYLTLLGIYDDTNNRDKIVAKAHETSLFVHKTI